MKRAAKAYCPATLLVIMTVGGRSILGSLRLRFRYLGFG